MTPPTKADIVDRVVAVEQDHRTGVALRLSDHTPNGGYTALVDAADSAGLDLAEYEDGDIVAVAALSEGGSVEGFYPEGRKVFPIVAVDTDNPEDSGFTIKFDRPYSIREKFPVGEDAAIEAIEDSYGYGIAPEDMDEGEEIGVLVTDEDGNFIARIFTQ